MATYNPFEDFNPAFTRYEYLESPKVTVEDPLFGTFDFISSIVAGDEEKIKKARKKFPKRIVAAILLILSSLIVSIIVNISTNDSVNDDSLIRCIINGN